MANQESQAIPYECYTPFMKLIFIAGPVRGDGMLESKSSNIENARMIIRDFFIKNNIPYYSPHLNIDQEVVALGREYDSFSWNVNAEMLKRVDALAVLPGWQDSVGTKQEIENATTAGKPVFYLPEDSQKLIEWAKG
jgi:hypothetical protein